MFHYTLDDIQCESGSNSDSLDDIQCESGSDSDLKLQTIIHNAY